MTKSELIERIAAKVPHVPHREVEAIVNAVFATMCAALQRGERIEIRGFGSFSVKTRAARDGRNPKTGQKVHVPPRRTLSFTVGKELRDRLNPEGNVAQLPAAGVPGGASMGPEPLAASPSGAGHRYTMG